MVMLNYVFDCVIEVCLLIFCKNLNIGEFNSEIWIIDDMIVVYW